MAKRVIEPVVERGCATMYCGDMRKVVPTLGKFTACVCDPPYELGFMGKAWDKSGIAFDPKTWKIVLDAVKPGGFLLAFGGTRTFHRIAVAIEDAGWEIRDCVMWLYGSGFPKSYDISKGIDKTKGAKRGKKRSKARSPSCIRGGHGVDGGDRPYLKRAREGDGFHEIDDDNPVTKEAAEWDGYGTALKPCWEPIIVAMKPPEGSFAKNALKHGVAGINIDGSRIGTKKMPHYESTGEYTGKRSNAMACGYTKRELKSMKEGRWPGNVLLNPEAAVLLDAQSGHSKSRMHPSRPAPKGKRNSPTGGFVHSARSGGATHHDEGGASRFFYTAKVSTAERNAGLEATEKNMHPTVKPVDLMRYLVKLVTMPEGTRILDPFAGSGPTLIACKQLDIECVGVTLDMIDCKTADGRLSHRVGVSKRKKLKLRRRRGAK